MAPKNTSPNYYDILGVLPDSTEKEILKGYRKKALICHPDKNPDNAKAAELFLELSEALKVLTDPKAKAAYDAVLKAKEAHKLRSQLLDAKRKKFKEDLETREENAKQEKEKNEAATKNWEEEIARLREEGSRLVKEQQEYLKKQVREEGVKSHEIPSTPKLKVRWKADKKDRENGGYSYEILLDTFNMYGPVLTLIVSAKKNGLAIVEYRDVSHAALAYEFEKGHPDNSLLVTWLEGKHSTDKDSIKTGSSCTHLQDQLPCQIKESSGTDFENMVLKKMQKAQQEKDTQKSDDSKELT